MIYAEAEIVRFMQPSLYFFKITILFIFILALVFNFILIYFKMNIKLNYLIPFLVFY